MQPVAGSAHRPDPRAGLLCHADDAPVPVLVPDTGKTKTGLLLSYVRDDRSTGSEIASAVGSPFVGSQVRASAASHKSVSRPLGADVSAGSSLLSEDGQRTAYCWSLGHCEFSVNLSDPGVEEALYQAPSAATLYEHGSNIVDIR
jgi:hypothetical protein